jgi:5-oxoprolinase (ATP-hydrolysing) subunit A
MVRVVRFGDAALRATLPEGADRGAVLERLRTLPDVIDAVVTEQHALVTFEPLQPPADLAAAVALALEARATSTTRPREHVVRVRYDGADLDNVARAAGLSREHVAAAHAAPAYVVAAVGFLPGFGYLRGLDPRLQLPRRAQPRPRVAALSVAIAGPYTGVYPYASPGGWHLLGMAIDFEPFDVRTGSALAVGDVVHFRPSQAP